MCHLAKPASGGGWVKTIAFGNIVEAEGDVGDASDYFISDRFHIALQKRWGRRWVLDWSFDGALLCPILLFYQFFWDRLFKAIDVV